MGFAMAEVPQLRVQQKMFLQLRLCVLTKLLSSFHFWFCGVGLSLESALLQKH